MVNLLDHRGLDLELLFVLQLVGDILNRDDGAGRYAASTDEWQRQRLIVVRDERDHAFDPHKVMLLDALLEADTALHGLEADVLIGLELLELRLDQVVGIAQASVEVFGGRAEVFDTTGRVNHYDPVMYAQTSELFATVHTAFDDEIAGA